MLKLYSAYYDQQRGNLPIYRPEQSYLRGVIDFTD